MIRVELPVRRQWRQKIRATGLRFCSRWWQPVYWDESACYQFTPAEVAQLKEAGTKLERMYKAATDAVIENQWWSKLGIPAAAATAITASHRRRDAALCGRFDLAWVPGESPKLLEYNADTPMAMLEAALTQRDWLQDLPACHEQFNHLHDSLVAAWKQVPEDLIHFTGCTWGADDLMTLRYLMRTAQEAGKATRLLSIGDVGWHRTRHRFVDRQKDNILRMFKLYPWEWLWREPFGQHLPDHHGLFIEPAWKMLWNSKGMLAVLWQLFPDHPNLLPTFESPGPLGGSYVSKPCFSREGCNISMVRQGRIIAATSGAYGTGAMVYQAIAPNLGTTGKHPTFGLWMVQGRPCALGIREDEGLITQNDSRFVPHRVTP